MRRCALGMLLAAAMPLALPAQEQVAGVYKWKDASGVVHYDDENLLQPRLTQDILSGRVVAPVAAYRVPKEFRDRVLQQCGLTRERVNDYRAASELYGRDPFGSVYRMSERQVALTIAGMDRDITHLCAGNAAERLYATYLALPSKSKHEDAAPTEAERD